MADALPILTAYAVYISPAVVALTWSRFSKLPAVQRLMKLTAKTFVVLVTFMFLFSFSMDWLCDGSAVKGYSRCVFIPENIANLSLPFVLLSTVALAILAFVVVIICGAKELASRSRGNKPEA